MRDALRSWRWHILRPVAAAIALTLGLGPSHQGRAQADGYNKIVASSQAALNSGDAAKALADSQRAIKATPTRWEAYVVAGGALQLERQYDQAIDNFTKALERSPEAKKPGIRALLAKCLSEETASAGDTPGLPPPHSAGAPSQGPTFKETLDWLISQNSQENYGYKEVRIEHYSNPEAVQAQPMIDDYSYHAEFQPSADGEDCAAGITFQSSNMTYQGGPLVVHFSTLARESIGVKLVDVQSDGGAGTDVTSNGPNDILGPTTTTVTTVTPKAPSYFMITGLHPYMKGYGLANWTLGSEEGGGTSMALIYSDRDLATRVAKAINHAIDVCGGTGKPTPF